MKNKTSHQTTKKSEDKLDHKVSGNDSAKKTTDHHLVEIRYVPDGEFLGQRIDKTLAGLKEIGTRSRAEHLLKSGMVFVEKNGQMKSIKPSHRIEKNDVFLVRIPQESSAERLVPSEDQLDIVYEDKDIIVVNKQSGMVVHPAAGHHDDTLVNALLAHTNDLSMKFSENRPGIVHRLDKGTSGLLVVAKNDFAHENLAKQFKERLVHRIYYAVVWGVPKLRHGKIETWIARHPTHRKKFSSTKETNLGKRAVTNFTVVSTKDSFSYLKLKLETGRTHQIRVHLSEMGHPIVGDELYGGRHQRGRNISQDKKKEIDMMEDFALHAAELGFVHPKTGEWMQWSVDWPEEKRILLKSFF